MKRLIIATLIGWLLVALPGAAQTPEQAASCHAGIKKEPGGRWTFWIKNTCGWPVTVKAVVLENKPTGLTLHTYRDAFKYRSGETAEFTVRQPKLGMTRYLRVIWTVTTYHAGRPTKKFEVYSDYGKPSFWSPLYDSAGGSPEDW